MIDKVKRKMRNFIMLIMIIISLSKKCYATEKETLPITGDKQSTGSVLLPTVSENEESPFDFILDPQELVYDTNAILYGGGVVEKGACLLFHNMNEGEYDFSRSSDQLIITNCSTFPVIITISASISDIGDINFVQNRDFKDNDCSVYMALVDSEGNEQPLSDKGEVSVSVELDKASEEKKDYIADDSKDIENKDFNIYSFGLTGDCNVNGAWEGVSVHPIVTLTWKVEPIFPQETIGEENQNMTLNENQDTKTEANEVGQNIENDENQKDKGNSFGNDNLDDSIVEDRTDINESEDINTQE